METFIPALTIFLLALVIGFEVITKVPPLLHTPLMSRGQRYFGCHFRMCTEIIAGDGEVK